MKNIKTKLQRKFIFIIIICSITLGFGVAYILLNPNKKTPEPWIVASAEDISKKFITKETLITQIHQKKKLITTDVEIKEKLTIDNSWGNMGIFKKIQNIDFVGTGFYTIDLKELNEDNITVDKSTKTINIKIPKPTIETISINEEKTIYETPEKGLLRFGAIKMSTEEQQTMLRNVKSKMSEKMLEKIYYDTALENSRKSLLELIQSIINSKSSTININFKN